MAGHAGHWKDGVYTGPNAQGVYAAAAKSDGPLAEIHNAWNAEYARLLDAAADARKRGDAADAFQLDTRARMLRQDEPAPVERLFPTIHKAARSAAERLGGIDAVSDAQRRYAEAVRVNELVGLASVERSLKKNRRSMPARRALAGKAAIHSVAKRADARFWLDNKGMIFRPLTAEAKRLDPGAFA